MLQKGRVRKTKIDGPKFRTLLDLSDLLSYWRNELSPATNRRLRGHDPGDIRPLRRRCLADRPPAHHRGDTPNRSTYGSSGGDRPCRQPAGSPRSAGWDLALSTPN